MTGPPTCGLVSETYGAPGSQALGERMDQVAYELDARRRGVIVVALREQCRQEHRSLLVAHVVAVPFACLSEEQPGSGRPIRDVQALPGWGFIRMPGLLFAEGFGRIDRGRAPAGDEASQ